MWLIISVPSNPASLMAFIFSSTDPFTPTVPHMMAFRIGRADPAAASASASNTVGDRAAQAATLAPLLKNSRRFMQLLLSRFDDLTLPRFNELTLHATFVTPGTAIGAISKLIFQSS